jgi:hypothetical protein
VPPAITLPAALCGFKVLNIGSRPGEGARAGACGLDITVEVLHLADQVAVLPEREGVAVCVDQVRKRGELLPLRFVVRILEPARVGPLPGALTSMKPISALA